MIEQAKIDAIKRNTDLKALVESRGIALKKNGKGYAGLCPFHDEKEPSFTVNPDKQLFHCFGCGKAGDVFTFVQELDGMDFAGAFKNLDALAPSTPAGTRPAKACRLPETTIQNHLDRVITLYVQNFVQKDTGKAYLAKRGIIDMNLFDKYRVGYCDGTLNEILPSGGSIRQELEWIGILMEGGHERFTDCIVVPVYDHDGQIVTLYARYVKTGPKRHLYLPDRPTGLFNIGTIKTYADIILVESVIDALSVMMAGFDNVISIQGTNGLAEPHLELFKQNGVQTLTALLDGDDAGKKAMMHLKEKTNGLPLTVKTLPMDHDPNSYLVDHGAQQLAGFIQTPDLPSPSEALPLTEEKPDPPDVDGFTVTCGLRKYQIMGLDKGPRKLKATVRLEHQGKPYADTLDFYSAKARRNLSQDICRIFNEIPQTIEADINRLLVACEQAGSPKTLETDVPQMTTGDQKEARAFGRSDQLMEQILADFETCGLLGEAENKLLCYLAMTSRKRQKPLPVMILAGSGAGKSELQEKTVAFCPPEDLVKRTVLSGKALFYKEQESLKHKVLAVEEGQGVEDAAYAIRSLVSAGMLTSETTIKDLSTGKLITMENRVEGPTAVFYTTTNPHTDPETKSRFFVLGIDESRCQTRNIQAFQRQAHLEDDVLDEITATAVLRKHWNFQRLLQPLAIKNPFSIHLTYGDDRLQGRRDQLKYLELIKAVAFTRQMQKQILYETRLDCKIAYIEVDLEDIAIANRLYQQVFGRRLDEISRPGCDLLMQLDDMVDTMWDKVQAKNLDREIKRTELDFTRRDIREYTGWSNYRVHIHVKELVELEYVLVVSGRNGNAFKYRLAYEGQGKSGERFILGLKSIPDLKKQLNL